MCILIKDDTNEIINICDVLTSDYTKFSDSEYLVKLNKIQGTIKSLFLEQTFKVIEEMESFSQNIDLVNFDCSKSSNYSSLPFNVEIEEVCGDGIAWGNEICDDGNLMNEDGCDDSCSIEDAFDCQLNFYQ